MVIAMATTRISITLPDRQLAEIRKRISKNGATVSGYIQRAVQKSLENNAEFEKMIEEALNATGGPPTPKERAWARKVLTPKKRKTKRSQAA